MHFINKKFSIQGYHLDRSVFMASICYRGPLSAVPTNEKGRKGRDRFQIDTSKTEGIIYIYICIYSLQGLRRFLLGVTNFVANVPQPIRGLNIDKFSIDIDTQEIDSQYTIKHGVETYLKICKLFPFNIAKPRSTRLPIQENVKGSQNQLDKLLMVCSIRFCKCFIAGDINTYRTLNTKVTTRKMVNIQEEQNTDLVKIKEI